VRNFTALSENLAPPDLSAMMNAYLTPMTAIIHEHHGTVDKYVGDLIMAFWGAPVDNARHAQDAVAAALAMQRRMLDLAQEFRHRGWPELSIGIGINTGTMNVGDMGSQFRKAYTVLGDAVNLASRLEGLTKEYGVDIIVGEGTRQAVPDMVYREIDVVRVKGKGRPVSIYQPLGPSVSKELGEEVEQYAQALAAYRQRRFEDAEGEFGALAAVRPTLRLYALYRARCAGYRLALPPDGWDGATSFETK
jgi:adenylate cyclase